MTVADWIKSATTQLKAAEIPSAKLDAEVLLGHVLKKDRGWIIGHGDTPLEKSHLTELNRALKRRTNRTPLAYITHRKEFYGLDLYVDERVLCPRTETESAVEQIIKLAPANASVLDMGTGSGAIAIAIKKHRGDLDASGSEVSVEALAVAKKNADSILGKNAITLLESDLFDNITAQYDIVVANLPYVTKSFELLPEVAQEPDVALFGGDDDGLHLYRKFFEALPKHLASPGLVYIESDPWQQEELIKLAERAGLEKQFEDYFILGFGRV